MAGILIKNGRVWDGKNFYYADVLTDGEKIIVKKSSCCCAFCGSIEELKDVKGTRVCGPCVKEIKEGVFFDAIVLLE